ncbi:MAG: BBP7 family outer membrane beta-barrel protein [Planctomycetia bacterium]|nr:BBP7 family outer membrane beta-barrel protein [Planctomycetia bacterium]
MTSIAVTARALRWPCLLAAVFQVAGALPHHRPARAADLGTYPAWTSYGLTEALIMGRDNQAANQPLVVEVGNPDNVLLSGKDAQFPFGGGVRAFYGARNPDQAGWEIGYFGLYGQHADAATTIAPPLFLQAPGPLGDSLTDQGEAATLAWNSTINGAEANVFRTATEWSDQRGAWRTIDWLVGFRYVSVEESALLNLKSCDCEGPYVPYGVRTSNNMFGGQVGTRGRLTWERWAFEGWAKAGLMGTLERQSQDALVDYLGVLQRPASSSAATEVGFIGDINLSTIYRLTDTWGIRAGYNLIWIGGVALAPDQFSFAADGPITTVANGGGIFLHGASLGLEARW